MLDEEEENIQIQHNQRVLASLTQSNYYAEVSPAQQTQQQTLSYEQSQQQQQSQSQAATLKNSQDNDYLGSLIEEVRLYRCLWDSSCRAFKEIPKKSSKPGI